MRMYEFTKNYMDAGTLAITMGYSSAATTVADAEANGIPLHDGAAYGLVVGRGGGPNNYDKNSDNKDTGGGNSGGWLGGIGKAAASLLPNVMTNQSDAVGSPVAVALEQRLA